MSEIQFLVSLMLENKLPNNLRGKILARIGEVESQLSRQQAPIVKPLIHAPSVRQPVSDVEVGPAPMAKPVGGEVIMQSSSGTSLKGPRKW